MLYVFIHLQTTTIKYKRLKTDTILLAYCHIKSNIKIKKILSVKHGCFLEAKCNLYFIC